jgi:type IV pilus assembly protein PilM
MDLSSLSNIFSGKGGSVLGVDIGSSSIKVVQLKRERGRAILETYGAIALGPYAGIEIGRATQLPVEKLAEALRDVIREANVTTSDAGLSIPHTSSLISVIKLPAAAESKLDTVMPLEVRKYIPVPVSEVELDWSVISGGRQAAAGAGDQIEVLFVAIHNETLEKYRRVAVDAGLTAAFFEIEVFSAVRAALEHGIAPIAVVDIGAATTKFYVVERGVVRESHIINRGAQELTINLARAANIPVASAEDRKRKSGLQSVSTLDPLTEVMQRSFDLTLTPLMSEISHTLASFEARINEPISAMVFTGGGATLKGFKEFVAQKLSVEVRIADPFSKTESPAFLSDILKAIGPEFSVAVGLALRRLQEGK